MKRMYKVVFSESFSTVSVKWIHSLSLPLAAKPHIPSLLSRLVWCNKPKEDWVHLPRLIPGQSLTWRDRSVNKGSSTRLEPGWTRWPRRTAEKTIFTNDLSHSGPPLSYHATLCKPFMFYKHAHWKCFWSAVEGLWKRPTGSSRSKPSANIALWGNTK